ncbi:MAG: PQQ-binding-like beta-propeller repeat protein [Chitinivibrionia bacterium]|nr:PQQ-binding-like beta-propeller repeat protein [Chitinivibrionia bacterium]
MNRQIIFTPEKEASRDLTYSEYSSCKQSIHILFQDKGLEGYEFLLKAYRAAISAYLSFHKIESPARFLRTLVSRFDVLAREARLAPSEYQNFGAHIIVNTGRMLWLLSSDERSVHIGSAGRQVSCADAGRHLLSEVAVVDSGGQTELFPSSIKDCMRLYAITPPADEDVDLVIGCGEAERNSVFESLRMLSPKTAEPGGPLKQYIPLKYLNKKVIAISLSRSRDALETPVPRGIPVALAGASHRNIPAITLYAVLIATIVLALFWGAQKLTGQRPEREHTPAMESRIAADSHLGAAAEEAPPAEPEHSGLRGGGAAHELALLWNRSFKSAVTSSPAAAGDAVVFGCRDGKLYALNSLSGEPKWNYAASAGIGASPAVLGERVVCADYRGNVFCLNSGDGSAAWKRTLPGKISSSPLIVEQKVIAGCYDGYVYCLALGDGAMLWRFKTGGIVRASPASNGSLVIAPSHDGIVYGISLGTGAERWRHEIRIDLESSPAVSGTRVVMGGPDGTIRALDPVSGTSLWKTTAGGAVKSGVSISGDRVYAGSNDGHLYCLSLETGSILWRFKTGDIVLSRSCVFDGIALCASYDGTLYMLDAETGEQLDAYSTKAQIYSSPLVIGDLVYFGNNAGGMYCLRIVRKSAV